MNRNLLRLSFITLIATMASACVGTYKNSLNFNPSEPLRVAVLPFAQVNSKGEIMETDPNLLIDNVALVSSKIKRTPSMFMRRLVQNELGSSSLQVLSPALIDAALAHHGYLKEDMMLDRAKIFQIAPKQLCEELLSCDAVLYGKVKEWDRSYYAIQSVSTVALDLRLVSARDGTVLFSADSEDSDSRGITKVPTGFSDLVLEPIKGLDNEIIVNLATALVKKTLAPLSTQANPEFKKTAPPSIFASAHDATNGQLLHAESLTVVMTGTPGNVASFSVGDVIQHVPMVERDSGHYIGEYFPLSTDTFLDQDVYIYLSDSFGRITKQKIGSQQISLKNDA